MRLRRLLVSILVVPFVSLGLSACETATEDTEAAPAATETEVQRQETAAAGPVAMPFRDVGAEEACGWVGGLRASQPVPGADGESWTCASQPDEVGLEIEGTKVGNTIAYEASGRGPRVETARLSLIVADPAEATDAHERLVKDAGKLLEDALDRDLPAEVEAAIQEGSTGSWNLDGAEIRLVREDLPEVPSGYTLSFVLE